MKNFSCLIVLSLLLVFYSGFSSGLKYPVSEIPLPLLKNADCIIRINEEKFEVNSIQHAVWKYHIVTTIMNENALQHSKLVQFYNDFVSVNTIEGTIYDSHGNISKVLKAKDITDICSLENDKLVSNERIKLFQPVPISYPFTVEYTVEVTFKKILNFPHWVPRSAYKQSVQSAKLIFIAEKEFLPRTKINTQWENSIESHASQNQITYEVSNLEAIEGEPLGPGIQSISPWVIFAPFKYQTFGYSGDFTTWRGVGDWAASLWKGRDILEKKYVDKIKSEIKAEKDTLTMIKSIYQYMQKNCRYVSTSFGLGWWQPETANNIARLGYGDCKGLVNYTKALLTVFGIHSIVTLVSAGANSKQIMVDFPSNQFNHVILAVPVQHDTIWLECTNPTQPFGFLGSFTDDRYALLLTSQGGILTRTPAYKQDENIQHSLIVLDIDGEGTATLRSCSSHQGLQYESVEDLVFLNPVQLNEKVISILDLPGLRINSVQISSDGDIIPRAVVELEAKVKNFASVTGRRMFIPMNAFFEELMRLQKDSCRKSDLVLRRPYLWTDTIIYHMPSGYKIESIPKTISLPSQFGFYEFKTSQNDSTLMIFRRLNLSEGVFPAIKYNDFVVFLRQINLHEKTKIILSRQ